MWPHLDHPNWPHLAPSDGGVHQFSLGRPAPIVLENESLAVFDRPTPTLAHYDDLLGVG